VPAFFFRAEMVNVLVMPEILVPPALPCVLSARYLLLHVYTILKVFVFIYGLLKMDINNVHLF
jgi:hypothetical protein